MKNNKENKAKKKLEIESKSKKLGKEEQQIFIKGIQVGVQTCLKKITELDRMLAIQLEMQKINPKGVKNE